MASDIYPVSQPDTSFRRGLFGHGIALCREVVNLMRVRQWPKNGLVFFPLILAPSGNLQDYQSSLILFLAFSCLASIVYIINDILDAKADRLHPTKCNRPIARGTISPLGGGGIALVLAGCVAQLALYLPPTALWLMAGYLVLNVLYSLRIKHIGILEIFCVALGFVIRVFAGAEVVNMTISAEFFAFVFFFCSFVSVGKRRRELTQTDEKKTHRAVLQHYNLAFLDSLVSVTIVMSGIFFWLHVIGIAQWASRPEALLDCLSALCVTAIMFRYLQAVYVEASGGSPVSFLMRDPFVLLCAFASLTLYWLSISPILS